MAVVGAGVAAPTEALARSDRDETLKQSRAATQPGSPLKLIVSIRRQRVSVWDGLHKLAESPISSGMSGHETPTGVFSILQKNRVHFSNIYDNAPMPFMQRLTWSGVALHAGALPGYPASHGCIRLPYSFAKQLFELTRIGARVIVARDDVEPQAIAHPRLPVPLPPAEQVADAKPHNAGAAGVDMLIGVRAAEAASGAAAAYVPQRTRASVAAARAAELSALADAVTTAELERDRTAARAKDTALEARRAREPVAEERSSLQLLTAAHDAARRGLSAAESRLASFVSRPPPTDDTLLASLARDEDELEQRIAAAAFEIEDLEHEIAEKNDAIARLQGKVSVADWQHHLATEAASRAVAAHKDAVAAKVAAERAMQRRNLPVTIFVSRKTGKLVVRQAFEPLFEAAVEISQPEMPIGTHVFTAMQYAAGDRALAWNVVTLGAAAAEPDSGRGRRATARGRGTKGEDAAPPQPQLPRTASVALSRITIPDDVLERLAEFVAPGSTFMVSDLDISSETGKGTDIVLLTR